jgi:hypothetical protein
VILTLSGRNSAALDGLTSYRGGHTDEQLDEHIDQQRFGGKTTMKNIMMGITIGTLLLGSATVTFAEGKVAQRQERQQQRIGNGVANGSMTAHETAKVEHQESRLNREVRTDRRANGGTLTSQERGQVNQQQNHLSNEIYRDKHNGANQQQ